MSAEALAGRHIVVTRPEAQAAPLARMIEAAGGVAIRFPLLQIAAADDVAPLLAARDRLADFSFAVFVSPNAVAYALPVLLAGRCWPSHLQALAVGPGTVKALAEAGVTGCWAPSEQFDSEGLLALPELAAENLAGRQIVIFRGDGGRELLADTFRQRGAEVTCVTCYQRRGPQQGFLPLVDAWQNGQLDAIVVSSSEALAYLLAGLDAAGQDFVLNTPLFVPHARIAGIARAAGLSKVELTAGADLGLFEGLVAYNWSA